MAGPAMEGSSMWKFHLGMEIHMALYTVTYCWYLRQKTFVFTSKLPNRSDWDQTEVAGCQSSCHIWLQVTLSGCYFVGTLNRKHKAQQQVNNGRLFPDTDFVSYWEIYGLF